MKTPAYTAAFLVIASFLELFPAAAIDSRGKATDGAAPGQDSAPSLTEATEWLNTVSTTAADLRGHVVIVQFWTYTCVNWLRTLPYVREWSRKYRDKGLVVIGVHSPEFEFEKEPTNVRRAVDDLRIDYPVALDSEHAVWQAWNNEYWPAIYLVDAQGRVRYRHFGEGQYDQTERVLQQLLRENGARNFISPLAQPRPLGVEVAADHGTLRSYEDYVGLDRARNFASPGGASTNARQTYAFPTNLRRNQWALSGEWAFSGDEAYLLQSSGRAAYRFHARDLNLVMGPQSIDRPVRFRVSIDGRPPGPLHGADVDDLGYGTADYPKMYQLIRQATGVRDRRFEIEFLDPGARLYAFTFG